MGETEYQFLILENAIKELKFDVSILPGKVDGDLKKIREILGWIERHHLPIGISKAMMERLRNKTIFMNSDKGKNAIAFQIHNITKRPSKVYELVGIKVTFGTSENGTPGLTFEGTRKDPVVIKACDLPWITETALKSPKKFEEWLNNHVIEPKVLSEKVEKFALIDLGLVEMNELGLGEQDHQGMEQEEIDEEKAKKNPRPQVSSDTAPKPQPVNIKSNTPPVPPNRGSESYMRRRSPMYQQGLMAMDMGIDYHAFGWGQQAPFDDDF